jgi:predicted outer membrane repeat protein
VGEAEVLIKDQNGGDCAGVCINKSYLYASSVTINFIANISSDASGAALYFNGSAVRFFNDKILFQDNEAGDEGAALWAWDGAQLYFINSSITFLRNRADLLAGRYRINPNPLGIGGAISIKQNSANIFFQGTTEVDFTSNSARNGGTIYSGGIVNFECASVVFSENVASSSGGAIFINKEDSGQLGGEVILNSSNGDIIFTGNQAGAGDAAGHDIYIGAGIVRITGNSGKEVINDGISGVESGIVNKSSGGLFLLGDANQYFRGTFLQAGGTTTVVGNYFTGKSSITSNSVLEFSTGAVLGGGTISLWDEAVMNITAPNDLTFSGEITGTDGTNINKPSSGTTKVESEDGRATYFAGISTISTSNLEFNTGTQLVEGSTYMHRRKRREIRNNSARFSHTRTSSRRRIDRKERRAFIVTWR